MCIFSNAPSKLSGHKFYLAIIINRDIKFYSFHFILNSPVCWMKSILLVKKHTKLANLFEWELMTKFECSCYSPKDMDALGPCEYSKVFM